MNIMHSQENKKKRPRTLHVLRRIATSLFIFVGRSAVVHGRVSCQDRSGCSDRGECVNGACQCETGSTGERCETGE